MSSTVGFIAGGELFGVMTREESLLCAQWLRSRELHTLADFFEDAAELASGSDE